jgi:hypothetical protein
METYITTLAGLIARLVDEVTTTTTVLPLLCRLERDAHVWEDVWLMVVTTILQAVACI